MAVASPLSQGRGLKQETARQAVSLTSVAPLAGAWIETLTDGLPRRVDLVAPLAGAWIETIRAVCDGFELTVAPLAGAWIETSSTDGQCRA